MSLRQEILQHMLLCHEDCSANLLELSWWEKSNVTFNSFHNFHLHSVNRWYLFFQITCTFQRFITEIALDFITTFASDMSFQITCCVEDSRAIFTFELIFITNTFRHVTASTIVWNLFAAVALMLLMCWCCCCAEATEVLMVLMHCCC